MRLSIQRLRWLLVAGALLLVVVLAAYIGYGRYRATALYRRLIAHSGAHITHDTNGFTYSQSVKGKTIFTLHAKKATQMSDGKWSLHDADMTLYGRIADKPDHIYGSEVEYDENEGVARAIGEVHMDLQAPQALAPRGEAQVGKVQPKPLIAEFPTAADDHIIHVKTSGLVYLRKLGVAATDQQVELHDGSMQCTAQGAEFNTGQNILRLLRDVKMDDLTHNKPLHVTAEHAEIDRTSSVATLAHPVVHSDDRTGRADSALLDFESDGSIHRVQGFGNVVLNEGTRQITAAKLDASLNDDMQLRAAHLSGSVALVDSDPVRPMQGAASQVDATFTAQGEPTGVTATGGAHLVMVDRKANARGLARNLEGAKIVAEFVPSAHAKGEKPKTQLRELHAVGAARASGESVAAPPKNSTQAGGIKNTQVAADDLRVAFGAGQDGKPQPQRLAGVGHTKLQQDAPLGKQAISSGDSLDAVFAAAPAGAKEELSLETAVQTGHVVLFDHAAQTAAGKVGAISDGTAQRAAYDGANQRLTLTGDVHWKNDSGQVVAPTVVVDQQTQDAEAEGGVQATLFSASAARADASGPSNRNDASASVTHILASSAQLRHASQISEFRGTDAHPAKMWQGASQIEAATLLFDGVKHSFSARPGTPGVMMHAVFASKPAAAKCGAAPRAANVVRVASPKMDYNDLRHEATFTGGVAIDGTLAESEHGTGGGQTVQCTQRTAPTAEAVSVRGERSVIFLAPLAPLAPLEKQAAAAAPVVDNASPSPFSGSLQVERLVVLGDVQLQQPGRKGTGDELLYTAASGNYVLTGTAAKPPVVLDAQQGSITGATLLFGDAGSTIVVAGDPGAAKKTRVRTETEVRQQ